MSDLSAAVGVDNAYATRSVEKLSALGYVNKVQDEQDRRAFRISLTASGRQIAERVNETLRQWVEIITAGVSPEEIATVNRVFDQFHQNALKRMKQETAMTLKGYFTWFKENWPKVGVIVGIFLTIYLVVLVLPQKYALVRLADVHPALHAPRD